MISRNDLENRTKEFFDKFCSTSLSVPEWSKPWCFEGTLTNNESKGCYAHLFGEQVAYIGLAIGNSYSGSGIGSRVSKYWKRHPEHTINNQLYLPTVDKVDSIITLPFDNNNYYLAAALEVYLIDKLHPEKNKTYKKSK